MKRLLFVLACFVFALCSNAEDASRKVAFLSLGGAQQSETNAQAWFNSDYAYTNKAVITDFDQISNYDVLWIHLDRIGQGRDDRYFTPEQISKIGAWVKNGGRLLLTTQATKLVAAMGRTNGYAPNEYNSGDGGQNDDTWGINAITESNKQHAIYNGLETATLSNQAGCYPLINGCFKLDHNCMWKLTSDGGYNMSSADFESATNSRILGTWQQNTDLMFPAIVEFYPNTTWKGVILACGIAAFDWNASAKHDNFTKFAANMLDYVRTCNITSDYPDSYTLQGVPDEKAGENEDNAVFKYNPITKTAYLYDADHTKMFIRRIPRFITFEGVRYEVIGIDPRMKEIPLKYVDMDQGGENNRENVHFNFDVALNPHDYFGSHVIVYVLDRDFKREGNASYEYIYNGEATNANSVNICIDSKVNVLKMEDKHPLMFPGKGVAVDPYPAGHAFDAKKIVFDRVFTPGTTSTLVLPFSLTEAEADAFGTFYDFDSFADNKLNFKKHTGATEARVPYIFLPRVSKMPELVYDDWNSAKRVMRTLDDAGNEYDHSITKDNYEFHGSFEFLKVYGQAHYDGTDNYIEYSTKYGNGTQSAKDLGIYAYNNNKFVTSTKWIGMRTFRCYIKLTNPTDDGSINAAKPSSVVAEFIDEDDADNIVTEMPEIVLHDNVNTDGKVFNIMGQQINASQPGLQIVNGKKYFNRK